MSTCLASIPFALTFCRTVGLRGTQLEEHIWMIFDRRCCMSRCESARIDVFQDVSSAVAARYRVTGGRQQGCEYQWKETVRICLLTKISQPLRPSRKSLVSGNVVQYGGSFHCACLHACSLYPAVLFSKTCSLCKKCHCRLVRCVQICARSHVEKNKEVAAPSGSVW